MPSNNTFYSSLSNFVLSFSDYVISYSISIFPYSSFVCALSCLVVTSLVVDLLMGVKGCFPLDLGEVSYLTFRFPHPNSSSRWLTDSSIVIGTIKEG